MPADRLIAAAENALCAARPVAIALQDASSFGASDPDSWMLYMRTRQVEEALVDYRRAERRLRIATQYLGKRTARLQGGCE